MFLAEVKELEVKEPRGDEPPRGAVAAAIDHWRHSRASVLADHGSACCRTAQEWLLAMDFSQIQAGDLLTGPRWIRARFTWGPTRWPIHWCEALSSKTLDCGALAALAKSVFIARGISCYSALLIEQYSKDDSKHWLANWQHGGACTGWIRDGLVYHEACAITVGSEIRIWDATASWWVDPLQREGYGAVLAVRILMENPGTQELTLGNHKLIPNQWQQLIHTPG